MKNLGRSEDLKATLDRLESLRPGTKAQWGRMSVDQMLCHLCDSFRLPLGEKHASQERSSVPRFLMKWVALKLPLPWPRGYRTRPEMEQGVGGTPPIGFVADRERLVGLINRFRESEVSVAHPMFGRMSRGDWMRWGYLHVDHHLRQFGV